jgi:hypothetical protein
MNWGTNTKISLRTNLSTTKPIWIELRTNPVFRSERLTNSRLNKETPSLNHTSTARKPSVSPVAIALCWSESEPVISVWKPGDIARTDIFCCLAVHASSVLSILQQALLSQWYTCRSLLVNNSYHPVLIIKEKLKKLYIRSCTKVPDLVIC